MKILIIDNYDSFVYNLVQYVGEMEVKPLIYRNDSISLDEIHKLDPNGIIISPGPGNPGNDEDIGICLDVIKEFGKEIPILGVCLGHQAIVYVFGGKIVQAKKIMHGKISQMSHDENGILKGIRNPTEVMRYHSLIADPDTFPHNNLKIIAETIDRKEIFAVKHKKYPIYGVQFHPESIGTRDGKLIIKNFLEVCNDQRSNKVSN